MMRDFRNHAAREHQEISALIPWYLNGTLGEHDRRRVDAHLSSCADCRNELALDRHIYRSATAETAVEYMPAASLKRLQARLDGMDAAASGGAPAEAAAAAVPRAESRARRSSPLRWLMAASVAVMALALSLTAADRWLRSRAHAAPSDYYTVTTPAPRPPGEVIRAVFSPSITLGELQKILAEAGLSIVAGPTEAGVYSLAATSRRPVNTSLALLRTHAEVRFAESTQPDARPDSPP